MSSITAYMTSLAWNSLLHLLTSYVPLSLLEEASPSRRGPQQPPLLRAPAAAHSADSTTWQPLYHNFFFLK